MGFHKRRYLVAVLQAASITLAAVAPAPAADAAVSDASPSSTQADTATTEPVKIAEEAAVPAPQALGETLETVVVTAQKREQKLQEVPAAVTAFSQGQLETRGIQDVLDLDSLAPGLQVSKTAASATISQISIRGIGEINPAIFWDTGVGIYMDGVYIGKSQGSVFDAVDLQRIEVLRGPQGTLYGRNTIGGAINLITQKPSGEFGATEELEIGNYNALVNKISVDLPKYGIASIGFGARLEQRDGWVDTTPGSSVDQLNNSKNAELRFAVDFALAPGLTAGYRFDHSDINQNAVFAQLYRADPATFAFLGYPTFPSYVSKSRQTTASVDSPEFEHSKVMGHSLTLDWDVDSHNTFKSISAYRHLAWNSAPDIDGSPLPVAVGQRITAYHQWSQELQMVGRYSRVNYVSGLYYYTDDGFTNNPQSYFGSPVGNGLQFDSRYGSKTNAGAAYVQIDYKPIDPLTLTAGYRYTRERKSLDRIYGECGTFLTITCPNYVYLIPSGTHASRVFNGYTPTGSVAWAFNKDLNVYARYAQGFKSGGFNGEYSSVAQAPAAQIQEVQTPFLPENQISYELGLKATQFSGRAQLNLAVFDNRNKNMQESIFTAGGAAATVIRNAGKSTVRGVEVESLFVPFNGTKVQLNYAWLDPKYDEFIVDVDADNDPITPLVPQNQANNRAFVHAPRNAFDAVIDSQLAKFDWGALRAVADYSYSTSFYTYPYQFVPPKDPITQQSTEQAANDTKVPAYGILNLRLSLEQIKLGNSAVGELALWCRNCINEDAPDNFIDFGPGFGNLTSAYFVDPITYGITGIIRW